MHKSALFKDLKRFLHYLYIFMHFYFFLSCFSFIGRIAPVPSFHRICPDLTNVFYLSFSYFAIISEHIGEWNNDVSDCRKYLPYCENKKIAYKEKIFEKNKQFLIGQFRNQLLLDLAHTAWKVSKYGVFSVRIFLYSDWIRRLICKSL